MRELTSVAEVVNASGDDELIVWAAQGMRPGVRAWVHGDAVVVASPRAFRRDRLAIGGGRRHAIPLVRHALAEVGPSFRPLGEAALVEEVARAVEEVRLSARFSWMATRSLAAPRPASSGQAGGSDTAPPGRDPGRPDADLCGPDWLGPDDQAEVVDLLKVANPDSYAVPGMPGVRRWAGIHDCHGRLLSVAADAWSAPTVGLLSGVATAVPARGRGLGERVCRFVAQALLAEHGRAALMVDDDNDAAIAVYRRLGFTRRDIAAGTAAEARHG